MEGVRALPHFGGGEEDLSRVGVDLSRVWLILTCERVAVRDLPWARAAGLPLGVEDTGPGTMGESGAAVITALVTNGVLVPEMEIAPDTEHFLPARTVGGGTATPSAIRVTISPTLSASSMKYFSPSALVKASISCLALLAFLSN